MKKDGKKGFTAEFKEFITRGNVVDMAVGVIVELRLYRYRNFTGGQYL